MWNRTITLEKSLAFSYKLSHRDYYGGLVVKNLPCGARGMCSTPDWGTRIPHASEQLSCCHTAMEYPECCN